MKSGLCTLPLVLLALSGCAWLAPDYGRPAMDLPEQWEKGGRTVGHPLQDWWKKYDDPVLERLIAQALVNNGDLEQASARLKQALAQYDFASANRLPMVSATGTASRTGTAIDNSPLLSSKPVNASLIGGLLSYEVDLWGKQASADQAARATALSARYARNAAQLSVTSATAQLYFTILGLDSDITITRETIAARESSFAIVKAQYDHEAVNGLILRQAEAEMEGTRAQLPKLMAQRDEAESALAVLLGRSPKEIMEASIPRGTDFSRLPVPPFFPEDAPSSLLERRPDIASAEQSLIASNFDIGVARAAWFPTISLSSLLGVTNLDVQNIYNGTARTWQIGASLAGPVIDLGRTQSGVDLAKARNRELAAAYQADVRTAFKEVKDALSEQVHSNGAENAQIAQERAVKDALHLATLRYDSGYSNYIEVLDAERNLYQAQLALVATKLDRLNASVKLYKALGGGWEKPASGPGQTSSAGKPVE